MGVALVSLFFAAAPAVRATIEAVRRMRPNVVVGTGAGPPPRRSASSSFNRSSSEAMPYRGLGDGGLHVFPGDSIARS